LTWFEIRRVTAVGTHQRGKSNSIKDLLVKIARLEHLEIFEGDSTPFSIYASAWLERKKTTLSRSTHGDYRSIWKKYVLPYFGNMPLCRVTRFDVEEFLGSLSNISAKRKNTIMFTLKCLFNDAGRREEIDEPPTENIRRLKEIKPFIDPFSFQEMKLLLGHVDPHYGAYFTTAFLTGMRPNEMIALNRNRSRKDGGRFLEGLKEAEASTNGKT